MKARVHALAMIFSFLSEKSKKIAWIKVQGIGLYLIYKRRVKVVSQGWTFCLCCVRSFSSPERQRHFKTSSTEDEDGVGCFDYAKGSGHFGRNSNGRSVSRNIRDHLWRWSTNFGRNISTEIRRSIFNKPVLCPNKEIWKKELKINDKGWLGLIGKCCFIFLGDSHWSLTARFGRMESTRYVYWFSLVSPNFVPRVSLLSRTGKRERGRVSTGKRDLMRELPHSFQISMIDMFWPIANWHKNYVLFRFPCLVLSFLSAITRCFIERFCVCYPTWLA